MHLGQRMLVQSLLHRGEGRGQQDVPLLSARSQLTPNVSTPSANVSSLVLAFGEAVAELWSIVVVG